VTWTCAALPGVRGNQRRRGARAVSTARRGDSATHARNSECRPTRAGWRREGRPARVGG
jgi:hypothetical protein